MARSSMTQAFGRRYIAPIYRPPVYTHLSPRGRVASGGAPDTVTPCAGTPTTRWPDGPSSVTFAAARSHASMSATPTPSCYALLATSATRRLTSARCAAPSTSPTSRTSTARTSARPTVVASCTRASSNGWAPRTTSSPATWSRSAPTAGGTSSPGVSCTAATTARTGGPSPRAVLGRHVRRRRANLVVSPGAVGALDGGGTEMADADSSARPRALSAPDVVARKGSGTPLVMVTAYDAPSARAVDAAGVDMILVGDSVAMVVLGYDDTLHVTVADIAHHTAAVARAKPRPLIVADLPWMSYHVCREDTVRNAAALVRAGAQAVKLEGGRKRVPM